MLDDLERWAAESLAREAADERVRERWLRRQTEDGATFSTLLLDLAERDATVILATMPGQRHQGRITVVGADFTAVRTSVGHLTLLPFAWLSTVVPGGEWTGAYAAGTPEDRPAPLGVMLADALAEAAATRPRVSLRSGGSAVAGELRSMGADLITLAVGEPRPRPTYVRLGSVSEVSFFESG